MSLSYESFGKYILLEKLAVGGMAEIYLARSSGASGVGKFVAIKRILPQFTEQTEFIDMFKDEAKIAVNLSHANVVGIYEFGFEKNSFFLAMDYIEGRNLRQILNKMKKSTLAFSIEQVLYIIKEVAAGLDHAHRCIDANTGKPLNIIHRDMSPQNVMVSFEGEVKIVDFGIAKAETQLETTRAGTLKGKFGYMSPEQAEGQPVDLRTDVFALGIVLWELLANDRLFVANNEVNTLRKIRDCQIPSLRKINPNIAPELERIVGKALAKDRNLRYQTAAAFHRDLSRFLNRQYPDFSPQDFSVFVKTLFAGEILESRKKMVEFARIDINRLEKQTSAGAANTPENTIVTSTQGTENTEPSSSDVSNSNINFANQEHEALKKTARPAAQASPAPAAVKPATVSQAVPTAPAASSAKPKEASVARRPESWEQQGAIGRELPKKAGTEEVLGGRLVMDRSAFQQRSEHSFASRTISRQAPRESSSLKFFVSLVFFGVIAAAGAFYFSNPKRAMDVARPYLVSMHVMQAPTIEQVTMNSNGDQQKESAKSQDDLVTIYVTSSPSGAPIWVDGKATADVTPAQIRLPKNSLASVSVNLAGYLPSPYTEKFRVEASRTIDVKFKPDVKGFLNVLVDGDGQIYINDKQVASTPPARMIPVPANEDLKVVVYDPKTRAMDQKIIQVAPDQTQTIRLAPRMLTQPAPAAASAQPSNAAGAPSKLRR